MRRKCASGAAAAIWWPQYAIGVAWGLSGIQHHRGSTLSGSASSALNWLSTML